MELALVMICLADRSWPEALDSVVEHGIAQVEPCSGGFFPRVHYDAAALVADRSAREEFKREVESRELEIACLSACANPLHPDEERAQEARDNLVATCRLASELGVTRVSVLSGCPGGAEGDKSVNWITPMLSDDPYPDAQDAYEWQWRERGVPYWSEALEMAGANGVTLCMEPIAGNLVYDAATFKRMREAVGSALNILFDPSHFFWMGFDIEQMIASLEGSIGYAHAKDVHFAESAILRHGLVPPVGYDDWNERPWMPRAVGVGHDSAFWALYLSALRRAGYDGPVAIEIEEPYMSIDDALRLSTATLRDLVPREPVPEGNWFDVYAPADS